MGALTGADIAHNFTTNGRIIALSAVGTSLLIGFADYLILSSNAKGLLGVMSGLFRFVFALLITVLAAISAIGLLFGKDINNKLDGDSFQVIEQLEQEFEAKRDSLYADVRIIEQEIQEYHSSVCVPESHKTRCGPECERKHAYCLSREQDIEEMMPPKRDYENELRANLDSKIKAIETKSAGISERYSTLFTMMQNDMVKMGLAIILFGIIFLFDLQALVAKLTVSKSEYESSKEQLNKKFEPIRAETNRQTAEFELKQQMIHQRIAQVKELSASHRMAMQVIDECFKDLEGAATFLADLERVKKKYPKMSPLMQQNIELVKQAEKNLVDGLGEVEMSLPDLSFFEDMLNPIGSPFEPQHEAEKVSDVGKVEAEKVPVSKYSLFYMSLAMKKIAEDLWLKNNANPLAYAKAVYEWICQHISYNYQHTHDYQMTAREVYNAKTGQCLEMGILFVAMMRYKNIDSQLVYVDVDNKGKNVSHGCALVRFYSQTMLVDPAYNTWNIKHQVWKAISDDELHTDMIHWNA